MKDLLQDQDSESVKFEIAVESLIDDFPNLTVGETVGALEIVKARLISLLFQK